MDNYSDVLSVYENVVHDIKGPMTIIYTYAQLLEVTKRMPKAAIKHVDAIKRNCFKALKLVNDISDSSKIRDGYLIPSFVNTDIVELISKLTDSAQPFTINKMLNLKFTSDIEKKIMATDKNLIERVLLNLLSNAVKSTDYGGEIVVALRDLHDMVEISVSDNGHGIKKENLEHIFERYHTTDSSRGRGIGLCIVRELIEVLGGEITSESEVGKGTKMAIFLPVFLMNEEREKERLCDDFYIDNMVQIELSDEYY